MMRLAQNMTSRIMPVSYTHLEKARVFAAQSVLGAAKMVLEGTESVEQLRINVCSPNGTTIEAVNRLFENGFMDDVKEGFQAAVDRSIEMGKEKQ